MEEEKSEIRFLVDKKIYDNLKEKAKELDVPLASYLKSNIEKWSKNGTRREKNI